ncbi:NAD-dependent epimerase/dehydratase family protein [Verrucomicrobium sp. 3C]|uniref:NAD-dependent epimerase/dehydratase family protein n=1 Tax=Verrucomicrobium sp. 3C TaxID=1134055 RepID=UPI00037EAC94|nr:NAD-dependent epimerase/dehydratase family protein [Verrucomicrobium sp. 3C]
MSLSEEILLVGCGYVGSRVAQILHARRIGLRAWVRTESSRARLSGLGIPALAGDIGSHKAWESLTNPPSFLLYGPSSSRGGTDEYRNVFLTGLSHALRRFPGTPLLFLSSTSVYGQMTGELVDEESRAQPESETGRILRIAEDLALDADGVVLRIAGIYGPGRSRLLDRFLSGEATISTMDRWINQIHRDDVVSAILHFLELRRRREVVNIVDDEPVRESRFYGWLASSLGKSRPPQSEESRVVSSKRRVTHKRISNAKARALGWTPLYPSFREGLLPLLRGSMPLAVPGGGERCKPQNY